MLDCLFVLQGLQEATLVLYVLIKCKAPRCLISAEAKCCQKTNTFLAVILKFSFSSICLTHGELWASVQLYEGLSPKRVLPTLDGSADSCTTASFHPLPCHSLTFHIALLCHNSLFKSIHAHRIYPDVTLTPDWYLGYLRPHFKKSSRPSQPSKK